MGTENVRSGLSELIENWATVAQCLSAIVVAIAAGMTAWAAGRGIDAWKRKIAGESRFDVAKKALRAAYVVKRTFISVRNMAIYAYEYPEKFERNAFGHIKQEDQREATLAVYESRLKPLQQSMAALEEAMIDVEVVIGAQA